MKTSAIIAAVALASTLAAAAPASADWIDDRQANQMQRIEQGLRYGQLTRAEYNRLVEQQREIARLERILERDGRLSYAERAAARPPFRMKRAATSSWRSTTARTSTLATPTAAGATAGGGGNSNIATTVTATAAATTTTAWLRRRAAGTSGTEFARTCSPSACISQ